MEHFRSRFRSAVLLLVEDACFVHIMQDDQMDLVPSDFTARLAV